MTEKSENSEKSDYSGYSDGLKVKKRPFWKRWNCCETRINNAQLVIDEKELAVGDKIGEGFFSEVFRGVYKGEEVAIKRRRRVRQKDIDKDFADAFRNETDIMGLMNQSKRICYLYGYGLWEDRDILVMRLYKKNLQSVIEKVNLSEDTTLFKRIVGDIAEGLRDLHRAGVRYHDLKPDNCLLDENDRVVITDFGIASTKNETRRERKMPIGSVKYMAPEAFHQNKMVSFSFDIWTLGVTLIQIWTGKEPWDGTDLRSVAHRVKRLRAHEPIPDEMPEPYRSLVMACFAGEPKDRPDAETCLQIIRGAPNQIPPRSPSAPPDAAKIASDKMRALKNISTRGKKIHKFRNTKYGDPVDRLIQDAKTGRRRRRRRDSESSRSSSAATDSYTEGGGGESSSASYSFGDEYYWPAESGRPHLGGGRSSSSRRAGGGGGGGGRGRGSRGGRKAGRGRGGRRSRRVMADPSGGSRRSVPGGSSVAGGSSVGGSTVSATSVPGGASTLSAVSAVSAAGTQSMGGSTLSMNGSTSRSTSDSYSA